MALKLDEKRIEESYGTIQDCLNKAVVDAIGDLAAVLVPESGTNPLADELIGLCKKAQDQYNDEYLPCVNDTLKVFSDTFEVSEYLAKKATVGDLASQTVEYKTETVDKDAVIM